LKEDSSIRWTTKISLFMKKSNKDFSMWHLMVSSFNVLLIFQPRVHVLAPHGNYLPLIQKLLYSV
jgi:hypothetical protein